MIITHYRDNKCGTEGGTTLTRFKNIVNVATPIAVAWKAQKFPRISTHLMMAEEADTAPVTNFKKYLIVFWRTAKKLENKF
jgi:hypothetical protein